MARFNYTYFTILLSTLAMFVLGCAQEDTGGDVVVIGMDQDSGLTEPDSAVLVDPDATPSPPDAAMVTRTLMEDPQGVEPGDTAALALTQTDAIGVGRFVTSAGCALCHSNHVSATAMRDEEYNQIAPFNLWQGSMMANAARDPLWHAQVSVEVAQNPDHAEEIEAKCMRCHAPMASVNALDAGRNPKMADLYATGTGDAIVGLDGVACAVCHQIEKQGLGQKSSFSGGYIMGTGRKIYGPHREPATGPMQVHVNYTPTYGLHVTKAELCGTCHTVFTTPITPDGEALTGVEFPEQTTFLEWKNSMYATNEMTCQKCHMPTTEEDGEPILTRIARSPPGGDFFINERKPFGKHIFVGGNTLMAQIFQNERAILKPQATDEAFQATMATALEYLQRYTLEAEVLSKSLSTDTVEFSVRFVNRTGHKFPTGMPIRRVWVRATVTDQDGREIFRSGHFNAAGRLVDHRGDILDIEKVGGGYEPHHDVITRPDEVQIYEGIMADSEGNQTHELMRAARFLKDNRFLPAGYSESAEGHAQTQPYGVDDDDNFTAGADAITYRIPSRGADSVNVRVDVFFQSASARFIRELFQNDTPQVRAFRTMYERVDLSPEPVVTEEFSVQQ